MPQTVATSPVRLPGISFAVVPPSPPQAVPRMDIAGFVGFATSGPIGVPVAVQDSTQFAAVFGADAPIAWDPALGEQAYGLLGPAVRAFFRNGGQRCWVVRVADRATAQRDRFELPGVAAIDESGSLGAAILEASSCGSWADGLSVTTALESAPVHVDEFSLEEMSLSAAMASGGTLNVGDLLRLTFPAQDTTLYATVGPQSDLTVTPSQIRIDEFLWVWPVAPAPGSEVTISYLGSDGSARAAVGAVGGKSPPDGLTRITFDPPLTDAPAPGALLRARSEDGDLILDVSTTEAAPDGIGAIDCTALRVGRSPAPAISPPAAPDDFAERLTLRLTVTAPTSPPVTLGGLGFAPAAAQFIGALPTDEAFYAATAPSRGGASTNSPLCAPDPPPRRYVPLGTTVLTSPPLGAMYPDSPTLTRDGLSVFGSQLFLDPALATEPEPTLLQTAAWIRDQSPQARPLSGIHALLDNDEVTLLAVPDAVQRGWMTTTVQGPPQPAPPAPVTGPDWSMFQACSTRVLNAPEFSVPASPPAADSGSLVHLNWSATDAEDATYELQRASDPDYHDASDVYVGTARQFDLSPPPPGSNIYLRVRAIAGGLQSAWSRGLLVSVAGHDRWLLTDPATYSPQALLDVQVAALRMCAARGDLLAVLAMPEHYRTPDAISHAASLQAAGGLAPGSGQDPMFGFGALYHPWLYCADPTDPTTFRRTPPDGPAVGVAAGRAATQGAWVAPANQPLQDVLALDQPVSDADYLALAGAQINFVRAAPGGFLWLAADTLSQDPNVRPINVRRLLALLRRMAERYGTAHVFEPNSDLTRRTARRTFGSLLGFLFAAGAFSGSTAAEAFQVSTPVTADDLDEGRLIVELRVAPSQPLAFLTVLLVQSGTGTVQVISR